MTFRKQAIATLKQLRTDGYTLNVKLNATNEALHAELVRLESLITAQELDLTLDLVMYSFKLEDIKEQPGQSYILNGKKVYTYNYLGLVKGDKVTHPYGDGEFVETNASGYAVCTWKESYTGVIILDWKDITRRTDHLESEYLHSDDILPEIPGESLDERWERIQTLSPKELDIFTKLRKAEGLVDAQQECDKIDKKAEAMVEKYAGGYPQSITSEQLDQHLKASKAYDERCKTFKAALNTELLLNRNQSLAMMLNQPPSFMTKVQTFITSTDWQHVANIMAAIIIPILYALLFTTILTGAFTFKALKLAHSKAKHLAPIWNFIKFHPSIQGGYRSELLELAFGLA